MLLVITEVVKTMQPNFCGSAVRFAQPVECECTCGGEARCMDLVGACRRPSCHAPLVMYVDPTKSNARNNKTADSRESAV